MHSQGHPAAAVAPASDPAALPLHLAGAVLVLLSLLPEEDIHPGHQADPEAGRGVGQLVQALQDLEGGLGIGGKEVVLAGHVSGQAAGHQEPAGETVDGQQHQTVADQSHNK